jgi:tRNA pseudouridine55 synthase
MDGVLLVAKPAGVTSHDVVESLRRTLGAKTGHAGTLDPFATGLLVVLVGRGTRLQQYMVGLPKAYRVVARLGAVSDTGDLTGEVIETGKTGGEEELRKAVAELTGEIEQRVPAYSAVKVGGERLYRKARRGEEVEVPTRRVVVDALELLRFDADAQEAELDVRCSSGTYVRQLVADLGELCGAGAYCLELVRTEVGPFSLADADPERLLPLSDALSFLPEYPLTEVEAESVRHGRAIENAGGVGEEGSAVGLTLGGQLIAVACRRGDHLKPQTVVG